jgi:hypothetical protein
LIERSSSFARVSGLSFEGIQKSWHLRTLLPNSDSVLDQNGLLAIVFVFVVNDPD